MLKYFKWLWLIIWVVIVVGCSSDQIAKPAPLVKVKSSIDVDKIWARHTRAGRADLAYLTLQIGHDEQAVYIASPQGVVFALDLRQGEVIWKHKLDEPIVSGVSIGEQLAIVISNKGVVYALNTHNGAIVWRQNIAEQALAPAMIERGIVLIKTVSDNIWALAASNGQVLWTYAGNAPGLILRGGSVPQVAGDQVILGLANGKLASLSLAQGNLNWEQMLANPEGIFPVQRMVDIIASPIVRNGIIYDATYQGNLAAVEFNNGKIIWDHKLSTYTGMVLSDKALMVSDADSTILSFQPEDGAVNWKQSVLQRRGITAPALVDDYIVVGDAHGYVHWFAQKNGEYVHRLRLSWEPIRATPVVIRNVVYVLDSRGYIAAYRITSRTKE